MILNEEITKIMMTINDVGVLYNSRSVIFNLNDMKFRVEDFDIPEDQKILMNWAKIKETGFQNQLLVKFKEIYQNLLMDINHLTLVISEMIKKRAQISIDSVSEKILQINSREKFSEDLMKRIQGLSYEDQDQKQRILNSYLEMYNKVIKYLYSIREIMGKKLTEVLRVICIVEGTQSEVNQFQGQPKDGLNLVVDLFYFLINDFFPFLASCELDLQVQFFGCLDMIDEKMDVEHLSTVAFDMALIKTLPALDL